MSTIIQAPFRPDRFEACLSGGQGLFGEPPLSRRGENSGILFEKSGPENSSFPDHSASDALFSLVAG
jgi:hypothetical protein